MKRTLPIVLGALLASVTGALASETVGGRARIVNGDTLVVGGKIVGLYGIGAPGLRQTCLNAKGHDYACGAVSAKALAAHLRNATVSCQIRSQDAYGRSIAVCHKDREDLSAWMVSEGLAMAERGGEAPYVKDETPAWGKRRGLWAGSFEDPTHRKRQPYSLTNALADAVPNEPAP